MITWSIWSFDTPASVTAWSNGERQRSMRSAVISWNFARVRE